MSIAIGSTNVRDASFGLVSRALARRPATCTLTPLNSGLLTLGLLFMVGCNYEIPKEQATASGEELFEQCAQCHGVAAQGQQKFHAPAIAGLPQWYLEAQLKKFRSGARGSHPADVTGMLMRPMTKSFHNDGDLKAVAAYVSSMPKTAPEPQIAGGDAAKGKALFATCSACHGPEGAGMEQVKAPPLVHSSDWYLLLQLKKFKEGIRGATPADVEGSQMRPMATALADEQAMKDVVAHIATLGH